MRRLLAKLGTVLALVAGSLVAATLPASAAHYQGGLYAACYYPTNAAYDGVYVSVQGLGSDGPYRNATVVADAFVGVEKNNRCYRSGAVYHVLRVQIEKVAIRQNNISYHGVGPINIGKPYASGRSGNSQPKCGTFVQAAVRYSVRYTNGAVTTGFLNGPGFRRC